MSSKSYLDKKESSQEVAIFSLIDLKGSEIHYIYSSLWQQYHVRRIHAALHELSPVDPITAELEDLLKVFAPLKTSFQTELIHYYGSQGQGRTLRFSLDRLEVAELGSSVLHPLRNTNEIMLSLGFRWFSIEGIDYNFPIHSCR